MDCIAKESIKCGQEDYLDSGNCKLWDEGREEEEDIKQDEDINSAEVMSERSVSLLFYVDIRLELRL